MRPLPNAHRLSDQYAGLWPGHYRFTDFVKVGLPLNIIVMLVTVTLIPMMWPLEGQP